MTRSRSFENGINDFQTISDTAKKLLEGSDPLHKKIRLLGVSLSNFGDYFPRSLSEGRAHQLTLF